MTTRSPGDAADAPPATPVLGPPTTLGPEPASGPPSGTGPRPPRGFLFFLVFAAVGAGAAQMSAALLTLTLKATQIDAAAATTILSLSSGVAGVLTLVALPLVGRLSDRSRSRFGRRRPFLVGGAASFVAGGTLLVLAPNVPVLVASHLLITLGFVCAGVTTVALIADQLPADRRGPASALVSLSTAIGALVGMAVAQPFGDFLPAVVGLPTAIAVGSMLLLAAVLRDPQVDRAPDVEHPGLRGLLRGYWVSPVRHPGFALVFASRMLVFSGVAALNGYQALYLLRNIGVPPDSLGGAILLTVVINVGVSLLIAPAVGKLSDRLGVRKPFIVLAALILGAGLLLAASADSLTAYLVACGVVAVGQGVYFAVELALATRLLPDPENPAKDLAIVKIADNLPVTIVAAVAPALLAIGAVGGANFAALFVAGAVSCFVGGLTILLIRGAR